VMPPWRRPSGQRKTKVAASSRTRRIRRSPSREPQPPRL
jgi:hypothetical protein